MTSLRSMIAATTHRHRPLAFLAAIAMAGPATMASAAESGDHAARSSTVRAVRAATRDFLDVNAATAAGYVSSGSCASGPNEGAMGVHYVNESYLADGQIDVNRPEILVYEPRNGRLQLVAVEYFVVSEQWDAANEGPPVLKGQLFHFLGAPNRLRAPANYQLHVWAWKENPKGTFADWNPEVSCAQYEGGIAQGHVSVH
jgi:hypothetical protein